MKAASLSHQHHGGHTVTERAERTTWDRAGQRWALAFVVGIGLSLEGAVGSPISSLKMMGGVRPLVFRISNRL